MHYAGAIHDCYNMFPYKKSQADSKPVTLAFRRMFMSVIQIGLFIFGAYSARKKSHFFLDRRAIWLYNLNERSIKKSS